MTDYRACELCMRKCKADRSKGESGFCTMGDEAYVARCAPHFWEEPIISGTAGSGAIFFSGCSLGCVFCQNREISRFRAGKKVSSGRLAEMMLELRDKGVHNINLVTPTHFAPTVREAVIKAKKSGLDIPIIYNTSSYDTKETIASLSDTVDIYLPDMKYYLNKTAKAFSFAENYPEAAKAAISEMVKQKPKVIIENGIMKSGVMVRILLLPQHTAEAKLILKYIYSMYGDSVYVSLMSQYTPIEDMKPPLNRRVTNAEYSDLVEYAKKLGISNCFIQQRSSAEKNYIPEFDNTGI